MQDPDINNSFLSSEFCFELISIKLNIAIIELGKLDKIDN